jgi:acetyl esterase/lipase
MTSFETILDIPYGQVNGRVLSLDALRPESASGAALPAVIWLHGGGWCSGSKRNAINNHQLDFLAHAGFVVASIEYRLSDEAPFPAQIHDVKAAIRWLRTHPEVLHVDTERIAVAGFSAGGHLAALVGTTGDMPELEGNLGSPGSSTRVKAVIALGPPTDLTQNPVANDPSLRPLLCTEGVTPEQKLLGGRIEERRELARLANPAAFVGPQTPAFLIIHGSCDETVPVSQAEILYRSLEAAGIEATFFRIEGSNHGFWKAGEPYPGKPIPSMIEGWILSFLEKHLQGKQGLEVSGWHNIEIDCLL